MLRFIILILCLLLFTHCAHKETKPPVAKATTATRHKPIARATLSVPPATVERGEIELEQATPFDSFVVGLKESWLHLVAALLVGVALCFELRSRKIAEPLTS